jgi:antitoxin component YwqK of YwqJK toxin-antitoxin module
MRELKKLYINRYNNNCNRCGYWEIYHSNGELGAKGRYVNGRRYGFWEIYHSNGELRFKGNYVDGEREGYWEYYYPNGKLEYKGSFVNGKRDGYWERYYSNGRLKRLYYLDGNILRYYEYMIIKFMNYLFKKG